jgi:hypothetical protein
LKARRRGLGEEPFLFGALFIANASSLLLPGSVPVSKPRASIAFPGPRDFTSVLRLRLGRRAAG